MTTIQTGIISRPVNYRPEQQTPLQACHEPFFCPKHTGWTVKTNVRQILSKLRFYPEMPI